MGTVREDYSPDGTAWEDLPHDHGRSHAYRWGEDGIAGICDDHQRLCFALALWNGADPILRERLFGLSGNQGEDAKEYCFYLDNVLTHAYMKYLYRYPQRKFPLRGARRQEPAAQPPRSGYERLDTGSFDDDRYFDVFVEYAKVAPDDVLIQICREQSAQGRGRPFRTHGVVLEAVHRELERFWLYPEPGDELLLFTENESSTERLFDVPNATPYVKDGFHTYIVHGRRDAVNPEPVGSKAACTTFAPLASARRRPSGCACATPGIWESV